MKEKVGDYEILHSIRLGGKEVLFGYNPKDPEAAYMTCCREVNFLGATIYPEAVGSSDYLEIMRQFLTRLQKQAEAVEHFRKDRPVPVVMLGWEHCRRRGEGENLLGKLIILSPSSLAPEYRTSDCQLGFAVGGFGCTPGAGGRAVYVRELFSGEESRWNIGDVLGIADLEKLPDWAKVKLAEYEEVRSAPKRERGEER